PSQLLTTLDLDEYTLDSKQQVWAAYARINENILLYGVTYDPQNKTVSAKKFDDYMTNITEIIYNGSKRISDEDLPTSINIACISSITRALAK
ncbi:3817_t:CDS:2, partial [Gigaspora rosea]